MISVLFPVYDRFEFTCRTIESIRDNTVGPYEIVIWDNHSTEPGLREWLEKQSSSEDLRVFYSEENLGPPMAWRKLMQRAEGEYSLMLGNDMVVPQGWDTTFLELMEQLPEQSMIKAFWQDQDGILQRGYLDLVDIHSDFKWCRDPILEKGRANDSLEDVYQSELAANGGLFYRTEIREEFLFNGEVFMGHQDYDFTLEFNKMGFNIYNTPRVCITHLEQKNIKYRSYELNRQDEKQLYEGYMYFYKKWGWLPLRDAPVYFLYNPDNEKLGPMIEKLHSLTPKYEHPIFYRVLAKLEILNGRDDSFQRIQNLLEKCDQMSLRWDIYRHAARAFLKRDSREQAIKCLQEAVDIDYDRDEGLGDWYHLARLTEGETRRKALEVLRDRKPELARELEE